MFQYYLKTLGEFHHFSSDGRVGEVEWGGRTAAQRGEERWGKAKWGDIFFERDGGDIEMSRPIGPVRYVGLGSHVWTDERSRLSITVYPSMFSQAANI